MPVMGDPNELRALSALAKRLADDINNAFRNLDNRHRLTRYMVPNKPQVDDLYKQASVKLRAAVDTLNEIQRRMEKIATDLEQVNKT